MEEFIIKPATMEEFDGIWEIVENINNHRKSQYEDLHEQDCMTSENFALAIKKKNRQIFYMKQGQKIVGLLSFYLREADYIFFASDYIYIDYFYINSEEYLYFEQLFNIVKQYAQDNNISIICLDVYEKEPLLQAYFKVGFEKYRNRIIRTINGSKL